jgi:hypothetical protein
VFNPAVGTIEGTVERQLITGGAGSVINGGNDDDGCYRTHWRVAGNRRGRSPVKFSASPRGRGLWAWRPRR